ncbi:hypothetical protein B6U90_05445 [Thermoplasmatales archaeon ex4484_6]|nr:MAG: hypothetical protein B6U90_05445 [Thermoplasmatales archaeon ex4484_6]RLF66184.1 MAG: hypothetical protein DRN57_07640 [Thermoplasmata archaeon]
MTMQWTDIIETWLREGEEGAEHILDYPWDTEVKPVEGPVPREAIIATHPKIPFNIEVVVSKHFTNLVINPLIPTDAIDAEERMRLYKKLLHLNTELNLMKSGLVGYDDQPVIQVDLDLQSLSKHEFDDALTLLIVGSQNLINMLGLEEKVQEFMLERFRQFVAIKLSEGESNDDIMDFLVNRGGLDSDIAEQLIDQVTKVLDSSKDTGEETSGRKYEGPMYG